MLVHGLEKRDWRFVAVFAATSLEQLAKAALAEKNVLLLTEMNERSLLGLAGATAYKDMPRTVAASKAIDRYSAFNRSFAALKDELGTLLDVRNGVVHLASEPTENFDNIFNTFLRAVELLARELGLDEESFWGPELLPLVEGRRADRTRTVETTIHQKISLATATFEAKYRSLNDVEKTAAIAAIQSTRLTRSGDWYAEIECPACPGRGWITYDADGEWELEDHQWVAHAWIRPTHFSCAVCSLELLGEEAEWQFPDTDLPNIDFRDFMDDPPDEVPGYELTDLHPYPPPY